MGPDVCHLGELPVVEGQVWLGHEVVEELDPGACQQGGQREAEGQVWRARAEGGEEGLELPVFCLLPGGDLLGDLGWHSPVAVVRTWRDSLVDWVGMVRRDWRSE